MTPNDATSDPVTDATPSRPGLISLDIGAKIRLSFWILLGYVAIAVVLVSGLGWLVISGLAPAKAGAAWPAGAAVLAAQVVGLLVMRPWKERHIARWAMAWLLGRGIAFVGVLVFAALLYFPSRPDPLAYGLVTVSAYFASLLMEVAAYSREMRARTRPVASPVPPSHSVEGGRS